MHKVVSHKFIVDVLPPYLQDAKRLKQIQQLLDNFKHGLTSHGFNQWSFKLIMTKDIVYTFASFQSFVKSREVAKLLGVNKRNIKKSSERWFLLDTSSFDFWTNYKRAKHSNVLFESFQQLVIDWWTSETIVSPNRKNVIRLKTSVSNLRCTQCTTFKCLK